MKFAAVRVLLVLQILLAGTAFAADEEVEIRRLQGVLSVINQEIQASYQEYQLVVQIRRETMQVLASGALATPDPVNFEVFKEEQRRLVRRDQELTNQQDQILARIRGLQARKQPLLDRLQELAAARLAAPTTVPEPPPQTPRY